VTLAGIVMEVKTVVPSNALDPILANVDPASNVTSVKFVANLNAPFPILVTLAGIIIEVKVVVPENALFPILVKLLGIVKTADLS